MLTEAPPDLNLLNLDRYLAGVPQDWFEWIRKNQPVYWHQEPGGPGFWVLSRHADVVAATRNWQVFSSDQDNGGVMGMTEVERTFVMALQPEKNVAHMDPPEHTKYRKVVVSAMLPSLIARLEPSIRRVAQRLIDDALARGRVDFVDDIAIWLPLEVLAELGNIPIRDRQEVFNWVNIITAPDDPEYNPDGYEGYAKSRAAFQEYCRQLYQLRKSSPGDDLLSNMIQGEIDGQPVTQDHAASFFELLISAGSETTRTTLSHGLLAFLENVDQYEDVKTSPELLKTTATDEILRWTTPILYFHRRVMQTIQFAGQHFETGQHVIMSYMSANRDEAVFDEPYRFNVRRTPNRHLSFGGGGPHSCLGAVLAKLEIQVFFEEWIKKVGEMHAAGDVVRLRSNLMNGIKHLPIEIKAA